MHYSAIHILRATEKQKLHRTVKSKPKARCDTSKSTLSAVLKINETVYKKAGFIAPSGINMKKAYCYILEIHNILLISIAL